MKKVLCTLAAISALGLLAAIQQGYCPQIRRACCETEQEAAEASKFAPDEFYYMQRAYPAMDMQSTFRGFEAALAQIQTDRDNTQQERGIFANTWTLEGPGNIGARFNSIALHPTNTNIVYAASIGNPYSEHPERGVYRA